MQRVIKKVLDDDNLKIEVLRLENENYNIREISEALEIPKTTVGDFLRKRTYLSWWAENGIDVGKPIAHGETEDHHQNITVFNEKRYILMCAQNNTFVHTKGFEAIEKAAEFLGAKMLVGTLTYNKGGFQNGQKSDDDLWYDPKIRPYIFNQPAVLAKDLMWCGELNILPTATNPLNGFQTYTKESSGIIPHTKIRLDSVPTQMSEPTKFMYTTGSITKRNYIQKTAGQKASFHHSFGALLVEVDDDGEWFVRQLNINSDTGCFYDLDWKYTPNGPVAASGHIEGATWGDIHKDRMNADVANLVFYKDGNILDTLKPKNQFIHDLYDANRRSHHHVGDPHKRFQLYVQGTESVESEIEGVSDFLESIRRPWCKTVIVNSNHDRAIERWLKEADYKHDYVNAIFFLRLQLRYYESIQNSEQVSLIEEAIKIATNRDTIDDRFLALDESYRICGDVECGMHGDIGSGGAKGSISTFRKLPYKLNVGHSHACFIFENVFQAGTFTEMNLGYNKGLSNWSASFIVTYEDGKRTMITIKNGKYRA